MRTISPKMDIAVDARNHLGETPAWSQAEQALYWINCEEPPEVLRWDAATGDVKRWPMPERCGGIVLKKGGGLLVTLASGLFDFDTATGTLSKRVVSPLPKGISLHECAVDPSGHFWVGAINETVNWDNPNPGGSKLFRLEGDQLVAKMENVSCGNGLAFSPDNRTLYFTDAATRMCYRWDCEPESGTLSNPRLLVDLRPDKGFVDGATVDSEGGYWATIVYGSQLHRYLPDGSLDLVVELPFKYPTKVAFGGDDLKTLFITTLSEGEGATEGRDGAVFSFQPGVAGLPEVLFAG